MNISSNETSSTPPAFGSSWPSTAWQIYKWGALPIALFCFFLATDGWTAIRVAHDGYEQTTGVLTRCSGGKSGSVEYSYAVNFSSHYNTTPNSGSCQSHFPGEHAAIYYSKLRPDLSVANATPGKAIRNALKVSLFAALVLPALAALGVIYKTWARS